MHVCRMLMHVFVSFSDVPDTLVLRGWLHCNLCRTASKRRVKMPCQWLIYWSTCNLFCLAALSQVSAHVCKVLQTPAHTQKSFAHSYLNPIQLFLFIKLLLLFRTVSLRPAKLFSMRKTDSDGICPGSWPLRCDCSTAVTVQPSP